MRNRICFNAMLLLFSIFLSNIVDAKSVAPDAMTHPSSLAYACNGCSNSQIMAMAELKGAGEYYIYDHVGNVIHLIDVQCEPKLGGRTCYGNEGVVPSDVDSVFSQYHSAFVANGASESFAYTMSGVSLLSGNPVDGNHQPVDNGFINAYDTIMSGALGDKVIAYINNSHNYSGFYGIVVTILNPINTPIVKFEQMSAVVVVEFVDGSKRTYLFDKALKTYNPVEGTARDSHGNTIPEKNPARGTMYFFNGDPNHNPYDLRNIISILPAAPPDITGGGGGGCTEERWDGEALTCVKPL